MLCCGDGRARVVRYGDTVGGATFAAERNARALNCIATTETNNDKRREVQNVIELKKKRNGITTDDWRERGRRETTRRGGGPE